METASNVNQPRFEPNWRTEDDENVIHLPDEENRSPYTSPPAEIVRAVSETYAKLLKHKPLCNTFTCFAKLPPELRIMIWVLSMSDSRVVPIFYDGSTARSDCPIPPQLHVNYEARKIALEHYELAFGTGKHEPTVYFDFSKDELYFGHGNITPDLVIAFMEELSLGSKKSLAQCQKIQKITIDENPRLWDAFFNGEDETLLDGSLNRLLDLPGISDLRLLTVVRDYGNSDAFLVQNNTGEVQAWSVCAEGRVSRWTPTSGDDIIGWERDFVKTWKEMEIISRKPLIDDDDWSDTSSESAGEFENISDDEVTIEDVKKEKPHEATPTFRCVSINRLCHIPAWKERYRFLQEKVFVPDWNCLISEDTGFLDFLMALGIEYSALFEALGNAFTTQLNAIPPQDYDFLIDEVDFDLSEVFLDLLAMHAAPCLCRNKHEDVRERLADTNTLPFVEYLMMDWMTSRYIQASKEFESNEAHIKHSIALGEGTAWRPERRLEIIGTWLLDTINENMAEAVQDWIQRDTIRKTKLRKWSWWRSWRIL